MTCVPFSLKQLNSGSFCIKNKVDDCLIKSPACSFSEFSLFWRKLSPIVKALNSVPLGQVIDAWVVDFLTFVDSGVEAIFEERDFVGIKRGLIWSSIKQIDGLKKLSSENL